jgi:eukaryotic-like serine/threonine-protein kinase
VIKTGDVLAGKYRVERVLGVGGMGYVVSALHLELGQRVAVKFLMPELCKSEEPVMRFLREARAAVRIRNEHVARVLDVGKLDTGAPYMVMEYLEGNDLADELEKRQRLSVDDAIDYILQASEAIAEAHTLGIVHRDLKPSNLFLAWRADGSALIKVLDFGISKAMVNEEGGAAASLTGTQALLGSPSYMSPEQVRKPKTVDVRTDVWALGVILYELLTGTQPFTAETPMSVLAAVVSDPTPSVRETRPDIPIEIQAIIERCLAKDPKKRYQSIAELADALAPFASPLAAPSVVRISGMLRGTPRLFASDAAQTIEERGVRARGDAETLEATPESLPRNFAPPEVRMPGDSGGVSASSSPRNESGLTTAEWGASTKPAGDRPRITTIVAIAGGAALIGAAVMGLAMIRTPSQRASEPAVDARPSEVPAKEQPVVTGSPSLAASAPQNTVPPVASTAPGASVPSAASQSPQPPPRHTARPVSRPHPAPSASAPKNPVSAQPPETRPTTPHPLEGRR